MNINPSDSQQKLLLVGEKPNQPFQQPGLSLRFGGSRLRHSRVSGGTAAVFRGMGCTNTASSATMITTMAATIRNVFLQPTAWFKGAPMDWARV